MSELMGKIAVVTGAAQGLGKAYAEALTYHGATVVTSDIQSGCEVVCDVREPAQVKALVDKVIDEHGRVDIAVANAGVVRITNPLDPWDKAVEDFEVQMGTNYRGVYLLGRAVAPGMAARGSGHIVICSTDHVNPGPGRLDPGQGMMDGYDSSKWALWGLTRSWMHALKPYGVRVNALCMGATDTPMLRSFMGERATPEMIEAWMKPAEVAQVLIDLIEEGPHGRTGEHIGIWMGYPVKLPPRDE